jgi:TRAP-type C4-dicarboxylate transport system permease small subunit
VSDPERRLVADAPGLLAGPARALALAGGGVLLALVALTVASVLGRTLLDRPVPGDFELIELGAAVAVFACLPYAQLAGANVIVDLFTQHLGPRRRAALDALGGALFGAIAGVLTWRLALGGLDFRQYGETTMVLRLPVWWAFPPMVLSGALLTVCCLYTAVRDLRTALGRSGAR